MQGSGRDPQSRESRNEAGIYSCVHHAVLAILPDVASAQDGPVMKRIAETKTINIGIATRRCRFPTWARTARCRATDGHLHEDRRRRQGGAEADTLEVKPTCRSTRRRASR
jgi:hypothetical protein